MCNLFPFLFLEIVLVIESIDLTCSFFHSPRIYDKKYIDLMYMEHEDIFIKTGCHPPCTFKKYSVSGDKQVI